MFVPHITSGVATGVASAPRGPASDRGREVRHAPRRVLISESGKWRMFVTNRTSGPLAGVTSAPRDPGPCRRMLSAALSHPRHSANFYRKSSRQWCH